MILNKEKKMGFKQERKGERVMSDVKLKMGRGRRLKRALTASVIRRVRTELSLIFTLMGLV